jgi:hypothetical protein
MDVITRECVGRETFAVYKKRIDIGANALQDDAKQSGRSLKKRKRDFLCTLTLSFGV